MVRGEREIKKASLKL